jgi:hypothetical protein
MDSRHERRTFQGPVGHEINFYLSIKLLVPCGILRPLRKTPAGVMIDHVGHCAPP